MVELSAHRCGAGRDTHLENTLEALTRAVGLDVEFVEFDVQRLGDGTLVVFHDDHLGGEMGDPVALAGIDFDAFTARETQYLLYTRVLDEIAGAGKSAHIDFKFVSPAGVAGEDSFEVQAAKEALDRLPSDRLIFTTLEDRSVRVLRDWLGLQGLDDVLCGLSLGRDIEGLGLAAKVRTRLSELFPRRRYAHSRANLFVCNHRLARITGRRFAQRHHLPMLVWTVDDEEDLAYWLDDRAWLVTTNFPERALAIRSGGSASP